MKISIVHMIYRWRCDEELPRREEDGRLRYVLRGRDAAVIGSEGMGAVPQIPQVPKIYLDEFTPVVGRN